MSSILFRLANEIVETTNKIFLENSDVIGKFCFNESYITNTTLKISILDLSNNKLNISINFSTHHLDSPWVLFVDLIGENAKYSLNDWKFKTEDLKNDNYFIHPNMLKEEDTKLSDLLIRLSYDLIHFINNTKMKEKLI